MLLPIGIEKHKNLSTSFTRFDHLLQDLGDNRFSGYIKLNFWGYEGVLVLDTGRMVEAYSTEQGVELSGEEAVLRILRKAADPEGSIEVHELSNEVAISLGYAFQSRPYKKDDSTLASFSLGQVFEFLERQSLSGYLDLHFGAQKGSGTVYYLEGTPVEAVVMSSSGKVVCGEPVFSKFVEIGERVKPEVAIHRVIEPRPIMEDEAFLIPWQHQKYIQFWHALFQYVGRLMSEQLKKNKFYENVLKVCSEVSDHYPFLDPENGDVRISAGTFQVKRVLHHRSFRQGIAMLLHKVLQLAPPRRLRKLDLKQIIADVKKIADDLGINDKQIDSQTLIIQVFRGLT